MNNNEMNNQNMNSGNMNPNMETLNPTPNNGPVPVPGVPETPPQPEVMPTNPTVPPVSPTPVAGNMGMEGNFGNVNQQMNQVPNQQVNLQPAGMVMPTQNNMPENNVATPLEATPLNANTMMQEPQNNQMPNNMNQAMFMANPMGGGMPPENPNGNNTIGMMGGIPTPPPIPEEPKKKKSNKKINTPLLIILIVVLIAAIGFGVYYFLNASKAQTAAVNITPILKQVELGADIGTDASYFATVTGGMAISNCTVNTNLDTATVGTYEYTVTCGNKTTPTQTVEVKDTKAPVIEVKEVVVTPNTVVNPEDFIDAEDDASEVTYSFVDPVDTSVEGEYEVTILASDEYENETTVTATLVVSVNAPATYMYCETTVDTEVNATSNAQYRFGITAEGELYNGSKTLTYQFADQDSYNEAISGIEENGTFDGYQGKIFMDDQNYIITVSVDMDNTSLAQDFSLSQFPTGEGDIQNLFENPCNYGDE